MTEPETHTLDAPGAVLHYDVRRNDASTRQVLLLIGSPMGAEGFGTLAGHFPDRTVVTYDPRGAGRSKRTDGLALGVRAVEPVHLEVERDVGVKLVVPHREPADDLFIGELLLGD